MKRIWAYVLVALISTWFVTGQSSVNASAGMNVPQEEIIIEGEKKSARFSHPVHLEFVKECGQCHHSGDHQPLTEEDIGKMENSLQLQCVSCHNKDFANPKLKTAKAAFHARCKDCHKLGVDGKKGPTKCTGCHVKK